MHICVLAVFVDGCFPFRSVVLCAGLCVRVTAIKVFAKIVVVVVFCAGRYARIVIGLYDSRGVVARIADRHRHRNQRGAWFGNAHRNRDHTKPKAKTNNICQRMLFFAYSDDDDAARRVQTLPGGCFLREVVRVLIIVLGLRRAAAAAMASPHHFPGSQLHSPIRHINGSEMQPTTAPFRLGRAELIGNYY